MKTVSEKQRKFQLELEKRLVKYCFIKWFLFNYLMESSFYAKCCEVCNIVEELKNLDKFPIMSLMKFVLELFTSLHIYFKNFRLDIALVQNLCQYTPLVSIRNALKCCILWGTLKLITKFPTNAFSEVNFLVASADIFN